MSPKVAVLMSGGVDSSVAALMLLQKGYEVLGITMLNWSPAVPHQARKVADFLGIEHQTVDIRQAFQARVIEYFCSEYQQGYTPNPCVICNEKIKFGLLMECAAKSGCELVSTGHYVRVEHCPETGRYLLRKGVDNNKDQSYFLYRLNQAQLARLLFPLGEITKEDTKDQAIRAGLPVPAHEESQEICFIDTNYRDFLARRGALKTPGPVVDTQGNILGTHPGLFGYTVGQRRGLAISAGERLYVVDIDPIRNTLVVGPEQELYDTALLATQNNFIPFDYFEGELEVEAKIRYAAPPTRAVISSREAGIQVTFAEPQRAITRGQSVVYYQGDVVVGGGRITKTGQEQREYNRC